MVDNLLVLHGTLYVECSTGADRYLNARLPNLHKHVSEAFHILRDADI